jgi:hypothetical protein
MGKPTNPMTLNAYAYVGGNPINVNDPSGRFWDDLVGAVGNALDIVNLAQCAAQDDMTCYGAITLGITIGAIVTTTCVGITGGTGALGCTAAGIAASELTYRATMEEYD